jgi:5-hydroxyisourate hydrolase
MAGWLTTHVLDTARGCPAADLTIELWRLDGEDKRLLATARTIGDGRTAAPLLADADFRVGTYELVFAVGDYFAGVGLASATLPFLDRVPVRFAIADPEAHYHVPLLTSPWAYSTYRGS